MQIEDEIWWNNKAKKIILKKEELTPVLFDKSYNELCLGSFEPTDILVNEVTYNLLCDILVTPTYSFRIYKKFKGAVANFSGASNRIILFAEYYKLSENALQHRKKAIQDGRYLATIFEVEDIL